MGLFRCDATQGFLENFRIGFFQVHFLAKENVMEKFLDVVGTMGAVAFVEPQIQTFLPVKFVGVTEQVDVCLLL